MSQEIRVRMAPSPTGFFHVGSLRMALTNFLFSRKENGKFVLRIEDTDQSRLVPGALENIVQTLADFGLSPDEGVVWEGDVKEKGEYGPYTQSKRLDIYKKYAQELIDKKSAYYCFCSSQRLEDLRNQQNAMKLPPKYDKHCLKLSPDEVNDKLQAGENHVIRLNVPADQRVKFTDLIHGEIDISTNDVDDQVLLKSDGFPTYHLAVVVDDYLMKISHIIRGDEWIPSTPKHILLYQAFGWEIPRFVHLPLLLSKTKKKLSKREGDVAVKDFVEQGYLSEALINFVALLGWNPKTEQEIFTLTELIDQFSFDKFNKAGAVFDLDKLDWINSMYIRKMNPDELFAKTLPYLVKSGIDTSGYPKNFVEKVLLLEQPRLKKLSQIGERVRYFFTEPEYEGSLLVWKKSDKNVIKENLQKLSEFISANNPTEENIKKFIAENNLKTGEVLWPLRVALSGLEASPGPFEIMDAFLTLPNGKEIIMSRIQKSIDKIS